MAIDVRELRVDYGSFVAVNDVSFAVPTGEVFGVVGPNGAGKTSTFRVLAMLMEPTYGEVYLRGLSIADAAEEVRRIVGYMPDLAPVPSDLKVWEFLDFYAAAYGLGSSQQRRERVEECLAEVGLTDQRIAWCKSLSRGHMQRVVLAKTLLHSPQVIILDEPASGLDPLARRNLRHALRRLAADGVTVFVSSHILSELAEMCTSLCVMHRGQLLATGTVDEVRAALGAVERTITATPLADSERLASWLDARDGVHTVRIVRHAVVFGFRGTDEQQSDLLGNMLGAGFRLSSFAEQRSSFEDILVGVAEGGHTP